MFALLSASSSARPATRAPTHRAGTRRTVSAATRPSSIVTPRHHRVSSRGALFVPRPGLRLSSRVAASPDDYDLDTEKLMQELTDTSQLGKRDEAFFLGQMALLFCVAFPPFGGSTTKADLGLDNNVTDPLIGLALLGVAGVLLFKGSMDLGNSLTPFPKPRADNVLKTEGAYQVVRHPMYAGLVFGSFGLALVSGVPVRLAFAIALAALLNAKAAKEETYLAEMHGEETYAAYAAKVPRLVPNVAGVGKLLEDTFPDVGQTPDDEDESKE